MGPKRKASSSLYETYDLFPNLNSKKRVIEGKSGGPTTTNKIAQTTLEAIYQELAAISVDANFNNPFRDFSTWSSKTKQRTQQLRESATFGLELFAIVLFSETFKYHFQNAADDLWTKIKERCEEYKYSLRMFAITRGIAYATLYSQQDQMVSHFGKLDSHPLAEFPPHPHEVYLSVDYDIKQCKYNGENQKNSKDCIYISTRFGTALDRPSYWPPGWKSYPSDPQIAHPNDQGVPHPKCANRKCGNLIASPLAQRGRMVSCSCKPEDFIVSPAPLVEIFQYADYNRRDNGPANRGVRALANFKKNDLLGVYVGDIIPIGADRWWLDPVYGVSFAGPGHPAGNEWKESDIRTCIVSAGWNGNWTRFLNHSDHAKVELQIYPIAGKQRIIVQCIKDIKFGEQLFLNYGDTYFKGNEYGGVPFRGERPVGRSTKRAKAFDGRVSRSRKPGRY